MKLIFGSFLVLALGAFAQNSNVDDPSTLKLTCNLTPFEINKDWITMEDPCVKKVKAQVQEELQASMTYLAMGAHFSQDTVNRPGFANLFFDAATEEREHATKLLAYLSMRGELTEELNTFLFNISPLKEFWSNGVNALRDALEVEAHVTRKIKDLIVTCEGGSNDYHFVDYLTADFLDEQYKGQRDLAGKLSTLGKMLKGPQGNLAEFLFDKKLLNGEAV